MIIDKYNARVRKINSLLCVGLDADFSKLPEQFLKTREPQFEFNKYIIEQTHEYAAAFKPNIAFYEARGDVGIVYKIGHLRAGEPVSQGIALSDRGLFNNGWDNLGGLRKRDLRREYR